LKVGIAASLAALILALVPCLAVLAGEDGVITITMTGANEISVSLDKTEWLLGEVSADTSLLTDPPVEWCTMTVNGNCNVDTYIVGENARWVDNPAGYEWELSSDGSNGEDLYGLWFRVSGDTARGPQCDGYMFIEAEQGEFWPYSAGPGSSLAPGEQKQFGLKLVTPSYFHGGRQVQARIIISAVAA